MALGLRLKSGLRATLLVATIACAGTPQRATPTATHPSAKPPAQVSLPPNVVREDPVDPRDEFLVHDDARKLVVRNQRSLASRVLVEHVDTALYDPALELVWMRDADRLLVLDLRAPKSTPVVIARGIPAVNRFSIEREPSSVETEDGCDLPAIALTWSKSPELEGMLVDGPVGRIENSSWLRAMLDRQARHTGTRRSFSDDRIALPKKLLHCEEPSACASTVAFGGPDQQLVLVRETMGGDCFQRACLVRNRQTGLFASALQLSDWKPATETRPGPCGPFHFDEAQSSFLVGRWLCKSGERCVSLEGTALGWLVPGDSVGEPGLGKFD